MKASWLSLERHVFRRIAVTAAEEPDLTAANRLSLSLEVARHATDADRVRIGVGVELLPEPGGKPPAYTGQIFAQGIFKTDKNPDVKIILTNGASILYGAIREMLLNITSRGPWPALSLPAASFGEMADDLIAQEEHPMIPETPPAEVACGLK